MKAVNLVPTDARRNRATGRTGPAVGASGLGPASTLILALLIVVAIVLLRVLADNDVNNKKATLTAVQGQVVSEKAEAVKLQVYVSFVQAAQAREQQVRQIAELRFPWKRTLDQISHVLPATTSLTSLSASTTAATTTNSTGVTVSGPSFALAGCADTKNQNGVATLLRRLTDLSGVSSVGFQNSSRAANNCGNAFTLGLTFDAPGPSSATTAAGSTSTVPATGTTTTGATG